MKTLMNRIKIVRQKKIQNYKINPLKNNNNPKKSTLNQTNKIN